MVFLGIFVFIFFSSHDNNGGLRHLFLFVCLYFAVFVSLFGFLRRRFAT